ncbi:hypothetical protein HY086_05370 [Candidatus Gottesmanbacteria bacterium]|nr:hypothetical protein [Candidatus Gottesmanbacteria bacterium]
MTYLELRNKISTDIFTILDVGKNFPDQSGATVRMQLSRLKKRGLIKVIKRGLYCFPGAHIDELSLARYLYQPSYISLETALNYHGVIPDVPLAVTCVTTVTTKKITTESGIFYYHKIPSKLFWGFSLEPFFLAFPEKALLDYTYLMGKKATRSLRIDWSKIDKKLLKKYDQYYR